MSANQGVQCQPAANGVKEVHVWFSNATKGTPCKCGKEQWNPSEDGLTAALKRLARVEKTVKEIEPIARRAR